MSNAHPTADDRLAAPVETGLFSCNVVRRFDPLSRVVQAEVPNTDTDGTFIEGQRHHRWFARRARWRQARGVRSSSVAG